MIEDFVIFALIIGPIVYALRNLRIRGKALLPGWR